MQEIEYYDHELNMSSYFCNGEWYWDKPTCDLFGGVIYWLDGDYHRLDGPAIEWDNGMTYWYQHGKLHREDGPAIEHYNGDTEWWLNGKIHRIDGPAFIDHSGEKRWYIHGAEYTKEEYLEQCTR